MIELAGRRAVSVLAGAVCMALATAMLPWSSAPAQATTRIDSSVPLYDVTYSPDGLTAYAVGYSVNSQGHLIRISLADNSTQVLLTNLERPRSIGMTRDGSRLVIGGYGAVYLVDPAAPSRDDSWINGWDDVGGVAISDQAAYVVNESSGRVARLIKSGATWPTATAFTEFYNPGTLIWSLGLAVSLDDSVMLVAAQYSEIRRISSPRTCAAPCSATLLSGTNESGSEGIAMDDSGTVAFYARANQASFRRLDLSTNTVSTITGDGGSGSRDAAISADGTYAYLLYKGAFSRDPRIQKVRISDNTVVATVDVPVLPCNSGPSAVTTAPLGDGLLVSGLGYADPSCTTLGGATYRFPTTPQAPTSLSATPALASATINFTPGADGLGPITNYEYSTDGTNFTALSPADATSPVTVTGLPNATPVTIYLRAVNTAGTGEVSAGVNVTPAGTPGPPTITTVNWDDTAAMIYFSPPASDGGAPVTTYEYSLDAGTSWNPRSDGGGRSSPLVVSGLTTNTTYSIDLRAVNSTGGGTTPAPVVVTPGAPHVPPTPPPAIAPGAPGQVTANPGDGSAVVTWDAPADQGSFPVTTYQVTSSPDGRTCLTTTTECTITGLTNGTAYTFTVRALNGGGWSAASEPSNAVTPRGPATKSIVITGSREARTVKISGTTKGIDAGSELVPWTRMGGKADFTRGIRVVVVGDAGDFTWKRRAARSVTIYFEHDGVTSNRVTIPAYSRTTRGR